MAMLTLSRFFLYGNFMFVVCGEPFQDLLKSTRKLVDYYKQQYGNMNLDGIYGLRVLEGQTSLILQRSSNIDVELRTFLTNINRDAHNISEVSLSFLQREEGEYFAKLNSLVARPLLIAEPYSRVDPTLKWPPKRPGEAKEISEEKSDQCISNLLGSGTGPICHMPHDCLDIFTQPGYYEYSLTHQILYTLVAQQNGCVDEYNKYLKEKGYVGGMAQKRVEFCTNVFYEAASLVHKQKLTPITQDLFMEQVFACGVMGFMEFVHVDWLRQVVQWQKTSGCFGSMPRVIDKKFLPKGTDYEYLDDLLDKKKNENVGRDFNDAYEDKVANLNEHFDENAPQNNDNLNDVQQFNNNIPQFVADNSENAQNNADGADWNGLDQKAVKFNDGFVGWREPADNQQLNDEPGFLDKDIINALHDRPNQHNLPQQQQLSYLKQQHQLPQQQQQLPQQQQLLQQQLQHQLPQRQQQQQLLQQPQQQQIQQQQLLLQQTNQFLDKFQAPGAINFDQQPNIQDPLMAQQSQSNDKFTKQQKIMPNDILKEMFNPAPQNMKASEHERVNIPLVQGNNFKPQDVVIQGQLGNRKLLYLHTDLSNYTRLNVDKQMLEADHKHLAVQRKLLVEKSLDGGCLAHKTAVAAGMISQYLRFYLDTGPAHYRSAVQIDGVNHMLLPIPGETYTGSPIDQGNQRRENPLLNKQRGPAPVDKQAIPSIHDSDHGHGKMAIIDQNKNYGRENEEKPYYNDEHDEGAENHGGEDFDAFPQKDDSLVVHAGDKGEQFEANMRHDPVQNVADINPKHKPVLAQDKGGDVAGNYPYYYDEDDKRRVVPAADTKDHAAIDNPNYAPPKSSTYNKSDSGVSVGTSYAMLLVIMLVLLFYVTKFVRRRRILIKYL